MMEAVARRKAHWLFGARSDKTFFGKRRPQEDMVTSAVFGSIRLLSPEDRFETVKLLLGDAAFETAGYARNHDIEVVLWPQFGELKHRRYVEPDVLLKSADKILIVEVKWHAQLSDSQLEQQVEAVGADKISAVVMLGEAGVREEIHGKPSFRRTWRDVSGDLQNWRSELDTPLSRWVAMMRSFLQQTDMGRIFNGLPEPRDAGNVAYRFSKPGHPPWFKFSPAAVDAVHYTFERSL